MNYIEANKQKKHPSELLIDKIGKKYNKKLILREVSLSLKPGEVVGLLGPNGAGKTTCFYIITGLIKSDYGNIYLDGKNITNLPMYRRARMGLGYLSQESSIFRGMTVEQNIMSVLELIYDCENEKNHHLENLLGEFSISHLKNVPANFLSGGERRRVELARCLASNPKYILLDEPLAGIDPVAINDIRDLIIHLKDREIGILITDHNVRDALSVIDRAYIIYEGEVLTEGTPKEIISHEEVRKVYLGEGFSLKINL